MAYMKSSQIRGSPKSVGRRRLWRRRSSWAGRRSRARGSPQGCRSQWDGWCRSWRSRRNPWRRQSSGRSTAHEAVAAREVAEPIGAPEPVAAMEPMGAPQPMGSPEPMRVPEPMGTLGTHGAHGILASGDGSPWEHIHRCGEFRSLVGDSPGASGGASRERSFSSGGVRMAHPGSGRPPAPLPDLLQSTCSTDVHSGRYGHLLVSVVQFRYCLQSGATGDIQAKLERGELSKDWAVAAPTSINSTTISGANCKFDVNEAVGRAHPGSGSGCRVTPLVGFGTPALAGSPNTSARWRLAEHTDRTNCTYAQCRFGVACIRIRRPCFTHAPLGRRSWRLGDASPCAQVGWRSRRSALMPLERAALMRRLGAPIVCPARVRRVGAPIEAHNNEHDRSDATKGTAFRSVRYRSGASSVM